MNKRHRLFILDDQKQSLAGIQQGLSREYEVRSTTDREHFFDLMEREKPSVLLFVLKSYSAQDLALCAHLRYAKSTSKIRLILFSNVVDFEFKMDAFEHGADDFIELPCRSSEVLARIAVNLRGSEVSRSKESALICRKLNLDLDRLEVYVGSEGNKKKIPMSTLEFELLRFFVSHREKVLRRDQILSAVWKSAKVSVRTIDAHVVSLRKKLVGSETSLLTVHGVGYILRPDFPV
jgi:DNA-binding response OmpR family regulator